jgi:hypothetical protein
MVKVPFGKDFVRKGLAYCSPRTHQTLQQKPVFRIHPDSLHPDPDPSTLLKTDPDLIQAVDESRSNLDPNPDPDPDPVFCKKKIFFGSKTVMYIFLIPYKGHSGSRRSLQPNKEPYKHEISLFSFFRGKILACLYQYPDSEHPPI